MSGFGPERRARRALPLCSRSPARPPRMRPGAARGSSETTRRDAALDAFRPGVTTPAVHCRRSGFGQCCDAALHDSSGPPAR